MTHRARKRFGQNFLIDHNIIFNILANLQARSGEHWVEIGPGRGALTEPLLASAIQLDVVELDRDLVSFLRTRFKDNNCLTIHSADALTFDFSALVSDRQKLRIVGNLPYNISTPLLFHLLESTALIQDMHFMLQKEVVDRICAEPGSKKYGRLSVMIQYYCSPEALFDVPPESFDPAPKVNSAIVKLTPYEHPPIAVNDMARFKELVSQAFSQRRKTLRNSLKKLLTEADLIRLNIDPSVRAEQITLEEFARLSNAAVNPVNF